MKKVAVLGSTGSIGTQTLDVIRENPDLLQVHSLVAYSNAELLNKQTAEFSPAYSALISVDGEDCLVKAAEGCDIAVVATRGIVALQAVLYCLDNGIDVALANKETLVCAGELVMSKVGKARLIPVDSEHCAIAECLAGRAKESVSKILLTASGGPFWDRKIGDLRNVTAEQSLKHPNWNMGTKITVDSATMMNKSLEVIEACRLFGVSSDDVQIVVHRQSIVHSMVEFVSGEVVAQLARPDMRLPIKLALLGDGGNLPLKKLDFADLLTLTFEPCDFEKFPCAKLGYEISHYPPLCATVMNAVNDVCVDSFIRGKLLFNRFYSIIIKAVEHFACMVSDWEISCANIQSVDASARAYARRLIDGEIC